MKKLKYLLFLFIIFLCPFVKADSFSGVTIAYGYDRGTQTGIWSGYSSTLEHNFGNTDPTRGYINTLNIQTILNNNYQNGNYYNITFNLQNDYSQYSSSFTLYDALQEMGHFNLKCAVSSTGGFFDPEACFTNYNIRFEKLSNNSVRGIVSITPLINFQRLLINITREGTPEGSQLISEYFKLSNFSYTVSTGGTGEIIDNQNQNTQDIINNQNENTQEIIDNLNENFNGCAHYSNNYSKNRNPYNQNVGYLSSTGSVVNSSLFRYTDYLIVTEDKTYFINRTNNNTAQSYCLYDSNKTLISCTQMSTSLSLNFLSSQDGYVRISYSISTGDNLEFSGEYCTNRFNELEQDEDINASLNTINDTLSSLFDKCTSLNYIINSSNIVTSGYLLTSGNIYNPESTVFGISDYIPINAPFTYKFSTSLGNPAICFYNKNKALVSCSRITTDIISVTDSSIYYFRTSIQNSSGFTLNVSGNLCENKLDNQTDAINDVNDSITDSNIDNDTGTGFFDNFTSEDFGLSEIITIPLETIQSLTTKTCVPLQVPIPFTNSNVTLPCMTEIYESKFPSIYNLWKIVSFGIIAYFIAVDIFRIVKGFKDPESDKVEVLDL